MKEEHRHEKGCACCCDHCDYGHDHGEDKEELSIWIRAGVLGALWLGATFVDLGWVKLAMYIAGFLAIGWDVVYGAMLGIFRGKLFDERFLMTVASVAAAAIGEWNEALAVLLLYQIGEALQDYSSDKTRENVAKLMDLKSDTAIVADGEERREVPPEEVPAGTLIEVRPGAKVPLDGVVVSGESDLDMRALTGESALRRVCAGDEALSGSINGGGALIVRTTKPYEESAVSRILELVEHASDKKARAERFITRFARIYTPIVCLAAVILAFLPLAFGGELRVWGYRALIFLVSSCPCAVVISVPLAYFAGIGASASRGVLVKGGNYLDTLAGLKAVVLDKTGTVTRGNFAVTEVLSASGDADALVRLVAAAESHSDHPIARAIAAFAAGREGIPTVEDAAEIPGKGVSSRIEGRTVLVGNAKLMADAGVPVPERAQAGTAVYVAADGEFLGAIALGDEIQEGSAGALAELAELGVRRRVMLTGDARAVAEEVAEKVGITEVHAELLPQDKVELMERVSAESDATAFVGDGINDAPVLAGADVGIAMGGLGSDAAIAAADVVIMDDNLEKLPEAVRLARRTREIVRENILLSIGVKLAVMALGAAGIASMWWAVFADVGICLIAVANCMRLGFGKRKKS